MPQIKLLPKKTPFKYKKRNYSNGENRLKRRELYNLKEWKELSRTYKMEHPLCEKCLEEGRITPAAHCHHLVSFMSGIDDAAKKELLLDKSNIISLCVKCHNLMHQTKKKGEH